MTYFRQQGPYKNCVRMNATTTDVYGDSGDSCDHGCVGGDNDNDIVWNIESTWWFTD